MLLHPGLKEKRFMPHGVCCRVEAPLYGKNGGPPTPRSRGGEQIRNPEVDQHQDEDRLARLRGRINHGASA
jgi:hypothetical protein